MTYHHIKPLLRKCLNIVNGHQVRILFHNIHNKASNLHLLIVHDQEWLMVVYNTQWIKMVNTMMIMTQQRRDKWMLKLMRINWMNMILNRQESLKRGVTLTSILVKVDWMLWILMFKFSKGQGIIINNKCSKEKRNKKAIKFNNNHNNNHSQRSNGHHLPYYSRLLMSLREE